MGIELKITAESVEEAHDQMAQLLAGAAIRFAQTQPIIEVAPEPEKPAARSRKKSDKPAEQPELPNEPTGSTDESTPSSGTASDLTDGPSGQDNDEPTLTYADVQKAVTQLAAAKGRDAVVGVFKKFSVDHGTKLKPEQWADAVAELETAKAA